MIHKIDKCEKCENQPICKYTDAYTEYTTKMLDELNENEVLKNLVVLGTHCIFYCPKDKGQIKNEGCNKPITCY